MTENEMLKLIEAMRYAFQRCRSIMAESEWDENPWITGNKCPLLAIQKVLDRGRVSGMEFYNFMIILHVFANEVMVCSDISFPEPTPEMVLWG